VPETELAKDLKEATGSCDLISRRVVFADDSATQRVLVAALLGDRYEVVTVSNGREALEAIRTEPPSVVLSDLRMPEMGGLELLAALKTDPDLRRIPFILVTREQNAAMRSMDAGADDYLTKPFGPEELRARVAAAVRSYRMYRELERQHQALMRAHHDARRLEIELRQAQKLESVGRLAAGIAHEINTPIQFIGDNTRFLEGAFAALLEMLAMQRALLSAHAPAAARDQVVAAAEALDLTFVEAQVPKTIARTSEGVERVAAIVRALKEFAHPDQKEMVATDLNRAVLATLEVARNEYKYVADVETVLGELPLVCCHAGDVNQVLLNVIVNAAQAICDQVKGTTARGRIRVVTVHEGEWVRVSISDTGGGIPESIQPNIFDPFFTTKEVGRGTGQGLAIARHVLDRHHGEIWFETSPGQGTTFHVRLPTDPAALASRGEAA
jgi:signal transduction histidine kinase